MKKHAQWLVLGLLTAGCVEQPPARRAGGNTAQAQRRGRRGAQARGVEHCPHPAARAELRLRRQGHAARVRHHGDRGAPGSTTLTWYWRVDATVGDGWRLFTHLDDASNPRVNKDGEGDVRRSYQPDRWRRGEFVADRQTIEVPGDWDAPVSARAHRHLEGRRAAAAHLALGPHVARRPRAGVHVEHRRHTTRRELSPARAAGGRSPDRRSVERSFVAGGRGHGPAG